MADLLGGPYPAPAVRRGNWLDDEIAGRVEVGGWTDAPIPWPRRKKSGKACLIVTAELARAVRTESVEAICERWGVSGATVWAWRKALGVGRVTDGTRALLQERTGVPEDAAARGRARAREPDAIARMAASKAGRPVSPERRAQLLRAACAPKPDGWGAQANARMLAGRAAKRGQPQN